MLLLSQPSSENTKTKKIISRAFSAFPIFVVSEKRLKETLSKKLPKTPETPKARGAKRKKDSPS
jgi:hypothetical protein